MTDLYEHARKHGWQPRTRNIVLSEGTQTVSTFVGFVPYDVLPLAKDNPRLKNQINREVRSRQGRVTQESLKKMLMDSADINLLRDALKLSGGSKDPVMSTFDFRLFEGNRRRTAYEILVGEGDDRFRLIPVEVFPQHLTEEMISSILLIEHVGGKLNWESIDRAREAYRMHKEHGWTKAQMATSLSWKLSKVHKYCAAFEYQDEYQMVMKDYTPEHFTHFYKLAGNKALQLLVDDGSTGAKDKFHRMIHNEKLQDCRHVANMHRILEDPEAERLLWDKGSTAADNYVRKLVSPEAGLGAMVDKATEALKKISPKEVIKIRSGTSPEAGMVKAAVQNLYFQSLSVLRKLGIEPPQSSPA